MPFKKIAVPLQTAGAARALRAGLELAKASRGHVEALHIRQRPLAPIAGAYPYAIAWTDETLAAIAEAETGAAAARKADFEAVCGEAGVAIAPLRHHRDAAGATASWFEAEGVVPADLAACARSADLVCVARPQADDAEGAVEDGVAEEALFHSGRPVLYLPPGVTLGPVRRVAIAWDGKREAARAVAVAAPIFGTAESVCAIRVGEAHVETESLERLADAVRLHGVPVEPIAAARPDGKSAEQAFIEAAAAAKADLIVMGAYSHNRWRQLVLGGFTRHLTAHATTPLLMVH